MSAFKFSIIAVVFSIISLGIAIYATAVPPEDEKAQAEEDSREGYHSRDWDGDDSCRLAQLAQYLAWDKDIEAKITLINIAINRVWANGYPDTITEVVYDMTGGAYISEEPDAESWDAEHHVQVDGWDLSGGATEFTMQDGHVITE